VATAAKWRPHLVEDSIPCVTLEDRVILSIALKDKSLSYYASTQQQQHSLLSQASWGRLEMKPKRDKKKTGRHIK
jgi:hypothetical protein